MEDLYQLVLERNKRETNPFVAIHTANATLLNQIDALQARCEDLEREAVIYEERLQNTNSDDNTNTNGTGSASGGGGGRGAVPPSVSLKNETRLREKLERLQEELNEKLKVTAEEQANTLTLTKELSDTKDLNVAQEATIANLKAENERKEKAIDHLETELADAKSRTKLAEQQYVGLKDTIRVLQEENDIIKKENREFESRFVTDKEKMMEEMNTLTESLEKYKREVEMLHSLKEQDEKRKTWFGLASLGQKGSEAQNNDTANNGQETRKFGSISVVLPSATKQIIPAHKAEASCVRYDGAGADLVATGGADSTVQVWDTANGILNTTLRGGSSNSILSCDISNGIVVAGGSDKTCRVWNLRTGRMIHHLVGHGHKVTCVRLFGNERGIITGSADRSMKVWDISKQTYRQTVTLRHSSTSNCVDVGIDSFTVVSAHLDGGIRFWDIRTGERTGDIPRIHEGAVTCVQFHPTDSSKILTNGMDSLMKLVDIRTCTALRTFSDPQFQTSYGWSSSSFSPNGKYVASGSSSNGLIMVWDVESGDLKKKLKGHDAGVCGFAWGRGGSSGQQVASVDKKGFLILWS